MTNEEREALIAKGWTPPPVGTDLSEVADIFVVHSKNPTGGWIAEFGLACLKRGRELGRIDLQRQMCKSFEKKYFRWGD